jgi:hypothetical protein
MSRLWKIKKRIYNRKKRYSRSLLGRLIYRKLDESVRSEYRLPETILASNEDVSAFLSADTPIAASNYLRPIVRELTQDVIQTLIKQRINRSQVALFLENKITETSLDSFAKLFESGLYANVSEEKKKYFFDLVMAVIYEELLSLEQIFTMASQLFTLDDVVLVLEKMVVLEYELYTLEEEIEETTTDFKKIYITDNVPILLYGNKQFPSYKDLTNVETEMGKIYDDTLADLGFSLPAVLSGLSFNSLSQVRINNLSADIESPTKISTYSFLLNYNTLSGNFDQRLLRQYYALQNGYYIKNGVEIDFSGLSSYSYYSLLSNTFSSDYSNAHIFIKKFWDQILERTINY